MDRDRVEELFERARQLPPNERAVLFEAECGGDTELRSEVESLLQADDSDPGFLGTPAASSSAPWLQETTGHISGNLPATPVPEQIGRFRVLQPLAAGGMGMVYLAEQESPRRTVALKVLPAGFASASSLARFELEAQALGRLQHPHIAQIFEAGIEKVGGAVQPWFAMEFVDGEPIVQHSRRAALPIAARVLLLRKVALAVGYAHQQGVIHRDLKSANILVDRAGDPKVLDFGVARVVDADDQTTRMTLEGQVVGTPAAMSPEQASGQADRIDERTDVYALGVLAYELLAQKQPYDLAGLSLQEALRVVQEREPKPLGHHDRRLAGDLQTIVGKALEKDPSRRYGSVVELASDFERYLNHEPITARPPSTADRVGKFVRRHRTVVVAASVLAVGLAAAALWTASATGREEARTRASLNLIKDQLRASDPFAGEAISPADTRALARAKEFINTELEGVSAAELRAVLGEIHFRRGDYDQAEMLLRSALPILEEAEAPDALPYMNIFALLLDEIGQSDEALQLFERCYEAYRQQPGEPGEDMLSLMNNLALAYKRRQRYDEAEDLYHETLDHRSRLLGPRHPHTIITLSNLAFLLDESGRDRQEAVRLMKQVVAAQEIQPGNDDPNTLISMSILAKMLRDGGEPARARPIHEQAVTGLTAHVGADHPDTLAAKNHLAVTLIALEEVEEAAAILRQVQVGCVARFGPAHLRTMEVTANTATLEGRLGRWSAAAALWRDAVDWAETHHPQNEAMKDRCRQELARALERGGGGEK